MILAKSKSSLILHLVFLVILIVNFGFWAHARKTLPQWSNVPPAPKIETAAFSGLGDSEISYRLAGYFLQNLGNVGGNFESLKSYNYDLLGQWFLVAQSLDGRADYVPYMAAYLFGSIQDEAVDKLDPVIDYLALEGQQPYPQKWRWLAQAVYLARFRQNDLDKALKLANILANLKTDTAPWARQMPAFIHLALGDKQAAYEIMTRMLATEHDKLHPNEVNAMREYICTRTLDQAEAAKNPLCQPEK
jgi:hypothetical protein